MKKFSILLHVLVLIAVVAILNTQAQLSRATQIIKECLFVGQMVVQPSNDESGTNSFTVFGKDGTNYFGIHTTNATIRVGLGGSNALALSTNYQSATTHSNRNMVFINGILTKIE